MKPILAEMLYLLTDEFVELESEKNLVTLRSGSCQYTISSLAAKSFPKLQIPFPEDTIQVKGINSLIRRTVFAANGDNIDYNRAGFFLRQNSVFAAAWPQRKRQMEAAWPLQRPLIVPTAIWT